MTKKLFNLKDFAVSVSFVKFQSNFLNRIRPWFEICFTEKQLEIIK